MESIHATMEPIELFIYECQRTKDRHSQGENHAPRVVRFRDLGHLEMNLHRVEGLPSAVQNAAEELARVYHIGPEIQLLQNLVVQSQNYGPHRLCFNAPRIVFQLLQSGNVHLR